ncbi:hypothetical protein ACFVZD_36930 [Streptomyces sp. NPDC058287]|uniref:hypothetical protein n=1 Tax=Streptomyces sp. NPDC058287 TaxID=3346423 RepID=UPI0036E4BAC4
MTGPDLPAPHSPMTVEALLHRWPTASEKVELIDGVLYFTGAFDLRDVAIAERAYPGRRALLNRAGCIEIHPAGAGEPTSVLDAYAPEQPVSREG